ncbi:MAG: manganese efflux pump MntP family protein [Treponema sp.]|nr:manganese efflux pump MntP family protein [Treponema sp.]
MNFVFFLNSALLGVGLAMDAFSVSIVNAITGPDMRLGRKCGIAGVYAFFQFAMPLLGWLCVHTIATIFTPFQKFIPWIALGLLLYIGGKMVLEALRGEDGRECAACGKSGADCNGCKKKNGGKQLSFSVLLMQGIATSIDALSVGFTIADYGVVMAVIASLVIAAVTFVICMAGLFIGTAAGSTRLLTGRAQLAGGIILILIGMEIFVKGVVL